MRKTLMAVAATVALGAFGFTAPASAETQAAPVKEIMNALKNGELQTTYTQWRGGHYYDHTRRGYRDRPRYGERRYYGPRRYGYNPRGYYRRDRGDALAAGALGLATGAIIGGALAQSQAQAATPTYNRNHAYCAQRYRSYDPASGTYLGYDGRRHPCP
ncbi:BA14K family protein [Microvirga roseola]|uniref:BA14K family protein n=1 Tax=Microvirga roseola TaxID=2883126 RepID=UPI001E326F87|nr:BA14K family protein [Microvirga roseola]